MSTNDHNGRGRLTDTDRASIHVLAEQGLGSHRIARRIGRHPSTVNWYMYNAGLRAPKPAPDKPVSYVRGGRRVHRFTGEEDAFITALRIQGFCPARIAELATNRYGTNRTDHTIRMRLTMLAAREETE